MDKARDFLLPHVPGRKERRRHRRQEFHTPVVLAWDQFGTTAYARGECVNVSESGFRVEIPNLFRPIPARTRVIFRMDTPDFSGSALVRHSAMHHGKMVAGFEFVGGLRWPEAAPDPIVVPAQIASQTSAALG